MRWRAGCLALACAAAVGAASAAPRARPASPATGPSAATQGAPPASLPPEYSVLQSRNPFAHAGKGGPGGPQNGAGSGGPGGPDAIFVLRGIVDAGGQFTAFVEDTMAKRIVELPAGAPLGPGRIKQIDADAIEYDAMGASRRIEVGEDLAGRVVPPIPATKPAGPQQPGPQQGAPNGPPGAGPRQMRGAPGPQGPQPVPEAPAQ